LYLTIWDKLSPFLRKRRFSIHTVNFQSIFAGSTSAVTPNEKN